MRTFLLSMATGWSIAAAAIAGDACKMPAACGDVQTCGSENHCGRCGCGGPCEKYCRVVCEMKEIKKTVWAVKCSEFCATTELRSRMLLRRRRDGCSSR